ncbi:MAG: hydroxyacid dehydrogenase [Clostridia bacterium]|nr:hydroxyacid dehydrogenase [Clostridia bacterium]
MKITILDAATLGADVDFSPFSSWKMEKYDSTAPEQIAARLECSHVAVVNKLKMNEQTLKGAKNLKLICVCATGFDNIDLDYCKSQKIAVCNVPGYSTDSVAQLTFTMALSLMGRLLEYREYVHSGAYSKGSVANRLEPVWHELKGKVWGVVGGGNIGRKVARIAREFGCRVLVCRRKEEEEFEEADLDTLCQKADILSLHLPLTEETFHIINKQRIDQMKKGTILINVARGAVADEQALADAFLEGRLGGLGIDVYSEEPLPMEHPYQKLLDSPRVILTPHTAWGSLEARNRCLLEVAKNIEAFFEGDTHNRII